MRELKGPLYQYLSVLVLLLSLVGCVTQVDSAFTRKASEEKALQNHIQLGLAYISQGDYVTAQKKLERAFEIDPKSPGAHAAMGLIYQHQGEPALAEKEFKNCLSYDPKFTRGRTYYAAFLYEQSRLDDAAQQLEYAGEDTTFEDRDQVFANLGLTYIRLQKLPEAGDAFTKALTLNPSQPTVLLGMSTLKKSQGDNRLAWQYYNRFLEQVRQGNAAQSASSLALGAQLAALNGDRNAEASLALLLRSRFPNSPEAKNYQSKP